MTEETNSVESAPPAASAAASAPALAEPRVVRRRDWVPSLIWLIPIVAALVGITLVAKILWNRGPEIILTFQTAEGLEANKTAVKYKDVQIGTVQNIRLARDRSHVRVLVQLDKEAAEGFTAKDARYWVVRPRAELHPESVTIHAITHAQIEAAPDFGAILGELLAALAGRVVVVHCREIERRFLDVALKARLGEGIEFPVIDTMELEARMHRAPPPGFFARLFARKPAPVSIRLADSRERYKLPRYRAHHALTDALATAELLQAQVAHRFAPEMPLRELWC